MRALDFACERKKTVVPIILSKVEDLHDSRLRIAGLLYSDIRVSDDMPWAKRMADLSSQIDHKYFRRKEIEDVNNRTPGAKRETCQIMFSYCWSQQPMVREIKDRLRNSLAESPNPGLQNIKIWFDEEQMCDNIFDHMAEAVDNAKMVIAWLSKAYEESANCRRELQYAATNKKTLLPVRIEQETTRVASLILGGCTCLEIFEAALVDECVDDIINLINFNLLGQPLQPLHTTYTLNDKIMELDTRQRELHQLFKPSDQIEREIQKSAAIRSPNSRRLLLERLKKWANDDGGNFLWLRGDKGSGKSVIACSATTYLTQHDVHVIAFPCRYNQEDLSDANSLIISLAFQLSILNEKYAELLLKRMDDIEWQKWGIRTLFEQFLLDPLNELSAHQRRLVIIIDALDECGVPGSLGRKEILGCLANASFPVWVKFIITSRRDKDLLAALDTRFTTALPLQDPKPVSASLDFFIDLGLDTNLDDIREFARIELNKIRLRGFNRAKETENIIEKCNGSFLLASLMCDSLCQCISLEEISVARESFAIDGSEAAGADFQESLFFLRVLTGALGQDKRWGTTWLSSFKGIVGAIVALRSALPVSTLAALLAGGDSSNTAEKGFEIRSVLARFSSLFDLVGDNVSISHKSLNDFLTNAQRCTDTRFFINPKENHAFLGRQCLEILNHELAFNMAGMDTYGVPLHNDIPDFRHRVNTAVSGALSYASVHFISHLLSATMDYDEIKAIRSLIQSFCESKLLFWVEVLSLVGRLDVAMTEPASIQFSVSEQSRQLLLDISRLVSYFKTPIEVSALHIYRSAWRFCPRDTSLYIAYNKFELLTGPKYVRGLETVWGASLQVLKGHTETVYTLAISPDGKTIASGSLDKTIRIWTALTGKEEAVLKGHDGPVSIVAFSPNGLFLASGSHDCSMRIWNTSNWTTAQIINGHEKQVWALCFSPDSRMLASGAFDCTVRVWSLENNADQQMHIFHHDDFVTEVKFSPDQATLASASYDKTVKLWDLESGECHVLEGHTDHVFCLSISADGKLLASGGHMRDKRVLIWDLISKRLLRIIEGHSAPVMSVSFSSDGRILASGSDDKSIRIWDTTSGKELRTLNGHNAPVRSVCFHPVNDEELVSCSVDKSIRIWDIGLDNKRASQVSLGHDGEVTSICLSFDSSLLATGGIDTVVRIWHLETGAEKHALRGNTDSVTSLAFSTNGSIIASGGADKSIRLWNLVSGEPEGRVLTGHLKSVSCLAFSPDGSKLVSGGKDSTAQIWDVTTGTHIRTYVPLHQMSIKSVIFLPYGTKVAGGSKEAFGGEEYKFVYIWDLTSDSIESTEMREGLDDASQVVLAPSPFMIDQFGWFLKNETKLFWGPPEISQGIWCVSSDGSFFGVGTSQGRVVIIDARDILHGIGVFQLNAQLNG
ncbi:hypothetical protein SmJEL517_g01460 [Synchytrium microbalum]|uniref:NACHT domain-containing protein n=1 Tax=Synchytrium microbalum TaxID=1806994 RepID=A0A507CDZ3_9FUNG|nr:uncharacterized protein SmJEL517_g01460 [Synchytrium microbalum]TPX36256.1 hypothetical protein SmJEL517_g01460 [Synchytrium microbalum]